MGLGLLGVGAAVAGGVTPLPPGTLPVVPGAFGFGMDTRAAYGFPGVDPTVYRVFSLADTRTAGTLRTGLEASVPRVVIFEISGYIDLLSQITISNPYLTVAGQTAPSPGITIRSGAVDTAIQIQTHDVLFQHLAIRPGWTGANCNSALGAWTGGTTPPYNIIFDHVSVSWGQDENLYYSARDTLNATVWRCLIAEGLFQAPGSGGCSGGGLANGHGLLLMQGSTQMAVLETVFSNTLERTPYFKGSGTSGVVSNCLMYNCHEGFLFSDADLEGQPAYASVFGNRFKRGSTTSDDFAIGVRYLIPATELYLDDNTIDNGGYTPAITPFVILGGDGSDPRVGSPPISVDGWVPIASSGVEAALLPVVGARPADRDAVDTRIVADITARTGTVIQTQAAVGGFPSLAVNSRALTLPANPNTVTGSGYTNLEIWLQGYATAVGG